MAFWLYSREDAAATRVSERQADAHGRAGCDAAYRGDFVVEAPTRLAAGQLAREWIKADDDIADMALAYRETRGGRSYAYLTRL